MKTKIIAILSILLVFTSQVSAALIRISSVDVIPGQPLNTDFITFNISGTAPESGAQVVDNQFSQNGTSLQLDLYVQTGQAQVPSQWTYSKQIEPLAVNNYTLEVRTFWYGPNTLEDTHTTDFTVVPEPGTLVLLSLGLPILRAFSRRKG